jgi:hypothetical protein
MILENNKRRVVPTVRHAGRRMSHRHWLIPVTARVYNFKFVVVGVAWSGGRGGGKANIRAQ